MRCPVRHRRRAPRKRGRAVAIRAWVEKCVARGARRTRAPIRVCGDMPSPAAATRGETPQSYRVLL
ncbi:hypothetical protein CO709_09150 [Burkholderia thailandensis]|nr:hypothetical protein CO709_09150 [Burkholderia thailandensis]